MLTPIFCVAKKLRSRESYNVFRSFAVDSRSLGRSLGGMDRNGTCSQPLTLERSGQDRLLPARAARLPVSKASGYGPPLVVTQPRDRVRTGLLAVSAQLATIRYGRRTAPFDCR